MGKINKVDLQCTMYEIRGVKPLRLNLLEHL